MAYLVAKYCLVFLVIALFGFLIGRWSVRRLFVDVTDSYETLAETSKAATEAPWDEIRSRFDNINGNVRNIVQNEFRAHPYPEIPRALFTKLENGLNDIKQSIATLPVPERVDLSGIQQEIQHLHRSVNSLSADVTNNIATHDDIDSLGHALELQLSQLAGDVAAIPENVEPQIVDFAPLEQKLASLQLSIESVPQPPSVDLSAVEQRLSDLAQLITTLPEKLRAEPTDLTPLQAQLEALRADMSTLVANKDAPQERLALVSEQIETLEQLLMQSATETQNALDFSPVHQRVNRLEHLLTQGNELTGETNARLPQLEQQLQALGESINQLSQLNEQSRLPELYQELGRIDANIAQIAQIAHKQNAIGQVEDESHRRLVKLDDAVAQLLSRPEPAAPDLTSLHNEFAALNEQMRHLHHEDRDFQRATVLGRFDYLETILEDSQQDQLQQLSPIDERLDKIQTQLNALNELAPSTIPENGRQPSIGPKLLKRPEFGKKDNLQEIAGIGPKLEQSLNKLGVYYYWQIAAWNKRDIRTVDANLEAFRGRIERDDWVSQAKLLRKLAHASRPPSGREMAQKLN